MGSILGAVSLLEKATADNNVAKRALEIIMRSVDNGRFLTNKMSGLIKKQVNNQERLSENLTAVINTVIGVQDALTKGRIIFKVDVPEDLPQLNVAGQNLFDIITNLISNAVDATPGEGKVEVRAKVVNEGRYVEVVVRDYGIGMDKYVLQRVYEPFFSTKNLDKRNHVSTMGNGLGLWNVHSLLQACGGDISITSAPGEGTEVRVLLPAVKA